MYYVDGKSICNVLYIHIYVYILRDNLMCWGNKDAHITLCVFWVALGEKTHDYSCWEYLKLVYNQQAHIFVRTKYITFEYDANNT